MAIRLSESVVEALKLSEGDEVEITITRARDFRTDRGQRREKALDRLRQANWTLPADWRFDREKANK